MASTIDLSGLEHYMKVLQYYGTALKNFHSAMEEVCAEAKRFAEKRYGYHGHNDITVEYDNGGTKATIYAKGNQVAFYEFGTGKVGAGTYFGNLPTTDVPITVSWEYYYPSTAKRTSSTTGEQGWYWDKKFHKGIQAEAEMWETAEHIRQTAPTIIQKHLKIKAVEKV